MGLFDIFKSKDNNESPKSELFLAISRYNEYIVRFMNMQHQGNYAPISAYEKPNGEITGLVYMMGNDNTYTLSAQAVIDKMEERFEKQLADNEIKSYVILYHSQFDNDDNHKLAIKDNELKAITVAYHFKDKHKGKIGLTYEFKNDSISYIGFRNFTPQENDFIFKTTLKNGKDYFQHREEITAPEYDNEAGIKIKKSNTFYLGNTWAGFFGFDSYKKPDGSKSLNEHFAFGLSQGTKVDKNDVTLTLLDYNQVSLKIISKNGKGKTILPVIHTDRITEVVNKEINEWENIENLEAIIKATGKDTFGISYFATDYAENRSLYHSTKSLNIKLSGIAFVLDVHKNEPVQGDIQYSEDFTMYMPSNDLPNYACFDFIGQVEDVKYITLMHDKSLSAYIMKIRLITNPDIKDFFTVDMYVTPENMRFKELTAGMKVTGMFQLQGQIAE